MIIMLLTWLMTEKIKQIWNSCCMLLSIDFCWLYNMINFHFMFSVLFANDFANRKSMTPVKVWIDDSETDLLTTIIEVNVEIEIPAGHHAAGASWAALLHIMTLAAFMTVAIRPVMQKFSCQIRPAGPSCCRPVMLQLPLQQLPLTKIISFSCLQWQVGDILL